MLIPVRCFSCRKVIGNKWEPYQDLVNEYIEAGNTEMDSRNNALNDLEVTRYCCRRMLLSHVDVIDTLLQYPNNPGEKVKVKYYADELETPDEPLPEELEDVEDAYPLYSDPDESEDESKDYNYVEDSGSEDDEESYSGAYTFIGDD